MSPDTILKKKQLQRLKSAELTKKPLVSPEVRLLENERRSKSPLLKDISMLSKKSLQREFDAKRKKQLNKQLNTLVAKSYKYRDYSPLSRYGLNPTPTLSARRNGLRKLSASRLRKRTSRPKVLIVRKDKPVLLKTRTEKRINTPLPEACSSRTRHSNSAGRCQESSHRSAILGCIGGIQSDKNTIQPQHGINLEQRSSEYKQQRSDRKPKAAESGRQQGSSRSKKQPKRATKRESPSKSIDRKLKYEEIKQRSSRQDLAVKRVLMKQASPSVR